MTVNVPVGAGERDTLALAVDVAEAIIVNDGVSDARGEIDEIDEGETDEDAVDEREISALSEIAGDLLALVLERGDRETLTSAVTEFVFTLVNVCIIVASVVAVTLAQLEDDSDNDIVRETEFVCVIVIAAVNDSR